MTFKVGNTLKNILKDVHSNEIHFDYESIILLNYL